MSRFNVTYLNRTKVGDDDYSILIPDGFHIKENVNAKAFVAWSGDDENYANHADADITLFDGEILKEHDTVPEILSPELCSTIVNSLFWGHPIQMNCEEAKFIPLADNHPAGGIIAGYDSDCFYYHVIIYFTKYVKMLRAQIQNVSSRDIAACDDFIVNWAKTLTTTEKFIQVRPLNDTYFVDATLSTNIVKEFKETADIRFTQIQEVLNYAIKARAAQFQATVQQGKDSAEAITDDVQKCVNRVAEDMDQFLGTACDALEQIQKRNPENILIKEMCEAIRPCINSNDTVGTSLDGGQSVISAPIKNIASYRRLLETLDAQCQSLLEKEKNQTAAIRKAQHEESMKKIASEKEQYLVAIEKWKQGVTETEQLRHSMLEDLKAQELEHLNNLAKDKFDSAIAKLNAEKQRCQLTLQEVQTTFDSLGFLQLGEKNRLKNQIKELNLRLSNAENDILTAKNTFEQEISDIPSKLSQKQNEWQHAVKEAYPMPEEPCPPGMSAQAFASQKLQDALVATLRQYEKLTVQELMERCEEVKDCSEIRVNSLLRGMLEDRVTSINFQRKTFYLAIEKSTENETCKEAILEYLRHYGRSTISDISDYCTGASIRQVNILTQQLYDEGKLHRTEEHRTTYYEII